MSERKCDFCEKNSSEVKTLVAGKGVSICDECVGVAAGVVKERTEKPEETTPRKRQALPAKVPQEVYDYLNARIIGQDFAKRVLSVATYRHSVSCVNGTQLKDIVLLIGPTGSGKTMLARTLAEALNIPFAMADATVITEAGYVGEDVESILLRLLQGCEFDAERASTGIVYIDEIDKIGRKLANTSITRDVSGEGVQQALLNLMEGTVAHVPNSPGRKHPQQSYTELDTSRIMFICGGTFDGLDKIVVRRCAEENISTRGSNVLGHALPGDLVKHGFIPEFAGRFTSIAALREHSDEDLVQILQQAPHSPLRTYEDLLAPDTDLTFSDEAVLQMARNAKKHGAGARGLRLEVDRVMLDLMFTLPSRSDVSRCVIDKESVLGNGDPACFTPEGEEVFLERQKVFISYSRNDQDSLEQLKTMLSPIIRNKTIDVWYDGNIKPSDKWHAEIERAMASSKVAVLLVSASFLSSDFIMEKELPYFLDKAREKSVLIAWLLIEPCAYSETDIASFQALLPPSECMLEKEPADRKKAWLKVAQRIKALASQ